MYSLAVCWEAGVVAGIVFGPISSCCSNTGLERAKAVLRHRCASHSSRPWNFVTNWGWCWPQKTMDAHSILWNEFVNVSLVCSSLHLESGNGTKRPVLTWAAKDKSLEPIFLLFSGLKCSREVLVWMKNRLIICYHSHPFHTMFPSHFPRVQIIGQTIICPLGVSSGLLSCPHFALSGCFSLFIVKFRVFAGDSLILHRFSWISLIHRMALGTLESLFGNASVAIN